MSSKRNISSEFNNPIKFKRSQDGVRRELFQPGSSSKKRDDGNYSCITVASPKTCMDFLNTLPSNIKDISYHKPVRKELFQTGNSSKEKKMYGNYSGNRVASPKTCMDFLSTLPHNIKDLKVHKAIQRNVATLSSEKKLRSQNLKTKSVETTISDQLKLSTTPHLKRGINSKAKPSPATSDFVKLEKLCYLDEANKESPASSVCHLLEKKMILNDPTENILDCKNHKDILDEIKKVIKKDHEEYEEVENKIKELLATMQEKHEENYKKMCSLIGKLQGISNNNQEGKENCSPTKRLQNKTSNTSLGSPVILKAGDLRKSALRKSLWQKNQINSPRIQQALNLYNSTRTTCSALLTPQRDLSVELAGNLNWRSVLSLKIQEQCYLLQDTPARK